MTYSIEKMIALGGSEWVRDDMRRIYFNIDVTAKLIGFEYGLRKTRIAYATLNGEPVSNTKGQEIFGMLDFGKIWFDVVDGKFHAKNISDEMLEILFAALKSATRSTPEQVEHVAETPLNEIYTQFTAGSQGFCIAVETECGFCIARPEIERIGNAADTAEKFQSIWENETWWLDANNAA